MSGQALGLTTRDRGLRRITSVPDERGIEVDEILLGRVQGEGDGVEGSVGVLVEGRDQTVKRFSRNFQGRKTQYEDEQMKYKIAHFLSTLVCELDDT